jgi:hypothetical protein
MVTLNVNPVVTVPDEIVVDLVRADQLSMHNTFRSIFEVSLSLTSALFGVTFSIDKPTPIHWVFLGVAVISTASFFILSLKHYPKGCTN